jgi:uncharacterized membrane protein
MHSDLRFVERGNKMKFIDILFWALIVIGVGIIIWYLFGSPDITSALIAVILFFAGSELLLWRKIFELERDLKVEIELLKKSRRKH